MNLRCLIIDDEPLAREGLEGYVEKITFLHHMASCESPLEALPYLEQSDPVDLIFLDIQMPYLNGIDFLKGLTQAPLVVLTTAYPTYALEAYQLDVVDYLVKPISFDRFFKAANKARQLFHLRHQAQTGPPTGTGATLGFFFVKCEHQYEKIWLKDILYIEGMQNYVRIHTPQQSYMTLMPLKSLIEQLPQDRFIQVHKSYVVPIDKIDALRGNELCIGPYQIPVSRTYKEAVMALITSWLMGKN